MTNKGRGLMVTKGDWVRSLSDEDLAKFIRNISISGCAVCEYAEHCSYNGIEEDFCLIGVEMWLKQNTDDCVYIRSVK